ncbi:MAG: Gfo/Idh/MocA family oxidoreductase, partial [Pseudomonadota bacterium]
MASIAGPPRCSSVLRVACVGAGYFSQFHYEAWERIENVTLVGATDRNPAALADRVPSLAHYASAQDLLAQSHPDLVDIITPPHTHRNLIDLAIKAGVKAIICQKPFCLNIAEAEQATWLAEQAKIPLIIHENFRFQPWYRTLSNLLADEAFGDLMQITFRLRPGDGQGPGAYLDRQPYFQEMKRFLVHETAVHWIDTFRFLLGEPQTVWADLRQLNPAIAGEDAGFFVFGYPDGRRAVFDGNRLADHPATNRRRTMGECLVEGTKMTAMLDGEGRIFTRVF